MKRKQGTSSQQSSTVGSTVVTSGSLGYQLGPSLTGKAVLTSRIAFIFTLAFVAATFGFLSYYLLTESEQELTEVQFHSIADRATCSSLENTERKRLGTVSLASVIGGSNPNADQWPFVTLNNYETISANLIQTSKGCNMAFAPFVEPSQLEEFETFIYDYYENSREPDAWPNGTAVMPFGKGVWAMNADGEPFHDTTGETGWGSNHTYLAPLIQHNTGPSKKLLMNFHSSPLLGSMMDQMLVCAEEKASVGGSLDDCAAITHTMPDRISWVQRVETGPGAMMMQPVYPSNNPTKVRRNDINAQSSHCFVSLFLFLL